MSCNTNIEILRKIRDGLIDDLISTIKESSLENKELRDEVLKQIRGISIIDKETGDRIQQALEHVKSRRFNRGGKIIT